MINVTSIPTYQMHLVEPLTGLMTREWYTYFYSEFVLLGNGTVTTALNEIITQIETQGILKSLSVQTAASATEAYPIAFSTMGYIKNMSLISDLTNSKVRVTNAGRYFLSLNISVKNTSVTDARNVIVWFKVNGQNVVNSANVLTVNVTGVTGFCVNELVTLAENDYVECFWHTTFISDISLYVSPSGGTPSYPVTPSAVFKLSYVPISN